MAGSIRRKRSTADVPVVCGLARMNQVFAGGERGERVIAGKKGQKMKRKERRRGGEGKVKWAQDEGGWAVLGWCHDYPLRSRQKHARSNVD